MKPSLSLFVEKLTALAGPRPTLSVDANAFVATLMSKEMEKQMGPELFRHYDYMATEYSGAVVECRRGNLPAALDRLRRTDELVLTLHETALKVVTLCQFSAWANYYYKAGQGEQAVALLHQVLHTSAALERTGCEVLIFRRIDQLLNIATIYFKQKQIEVANELMRNILYFVLTGQAQGLFIDDWDGTAVRRVRLFQEGALDEVVSRLAAQNTIQMEHPTYDNAYYYHFFFRDLLHKLPTDTYNRVVLYNWLYTKASYFELGPAAFLENVLAFVGDAEVASAYDLLKANLLAQVIWHFRLQPATRPLLHTIRSFAEVHFIDRQGKAITLPLAQVSVLSTPDAH